MANRVFGKIFFIYGIVVLGAYLNGCSRSLNSIGEPLSPDALVLSQGYTKGKASDLKSGRPTPVAPTIQTPMSSQDDIRSLGLSDPQAQIDWSKKRIDLTWSVAASSKTLKMSGEFSGHQGRLWIATLSATNVNATFKGVVKAKALCFAIDNSCQHLGIDLYYLPEGSKKILKQQFEAGSVSEVKTPPETLPETHSEVGYVVAMDPEREFTGDSRLVSYVSPEPETSFFSEFPDGSNYVPQPEDSGVALEGRWIKALEEHQTRLKVMAEERAEALKKIEAEKQAAPSEPERGERPDPKTPTPTENEPVATADSEARLREEQAKLKVAIDKTAAELEALKRLQEVAQVDRQEQTLFHERIGLDQASFMDFKGGGQSFNWVNDGYLQQASVVEPVRTESYRALFAEHRQHYASGMMISLLEGVMPEFLKTRPTTQPLEFMALSAQEGGKLHFVSRNGSHASHQNGLDADVHYIQGDTEAKTYINGVLNKNFPWNLNLDFFRYVVGLNMDEGGRKVSVVKFIFVNKEIKAHLCALARAEGTLERDHEVHRRLRGISHHRDHFHLRLRCSPHYLGCRNQAEPVGTQCDE
ncbi:MAG: penicillin-insensitive murein endopeptidase [Bdellovibrionales bacterium]|nr:penicillin-insensitive murein endopeptidase [Bdellovibrionales bacterium]